MPKNRLKTKIARLKRELVSFTSLHDYLTEEFNKDPNNRNEVQEQKEFALEMIYQHTYDITNLEHKAKRRALRSTLKAA